MNKLIQVFLNLIYIFLLGYLYGNMVFVRQRCVRINLSSVYQARTEFSSPYGCSRATYVAFKVFPGGQIKAPKQLKESNVQIEW